MTQKEKTHLISKIMAVADESLGARKDPLVIALYIQEVLNIVYKIPVEKED